MKRPKQLPAVDRTKKTAAVPAGANVSASGWFDDVVRVVSTVGPPLISAL